MSVRIVLLCGLLAAAAGACSGDITGDDDDDSTADGAVGDDGATAADAGPIDANLGEGEPPELAGITALHNQVRATVDVPPLTWDPDLAAIAQAWADSCTDNDAPIGLIDHNPNRSDTYPGYVGENVYGSSGTATPDGAVSAWAAEAADYDYDTNTCSAVCGHYTQLVWATTEKLGCGISNCSGLTYGNSIVCDYSPGGNTGGRPY